MSHKLYWVELKYDIRKLDNELPEQSIIDPKEEGELQVTLMRDYDGSLVLGISMESDGDIEALFQAKKLAIEVLVDLMPLDADIPEPVQAVIADIDGCARLYVPIDEEAKK
jgi:hypothetical protein